MFAASNSLSSIGVDRQMFESAPCAAGAKFHPTLRTLASQSLQVGAVRNSVLEKPVSVPAQQARNPQFGAVERYLVAPQGYAASRSASVLGRKGQKSLKPADLPMLMLSFKITKS